MNSTFFWCWKKILISICSAPLNSPARGYKTTYIIYTLGTRQQSCLKMLLFLFWKSLAIFPDKIAPNYETAKAANILHPLSERLACLGIMGDQLRAPIKHLITVVLWCLRGFRRFSSSMVPNDAGGNWRGNLLLGKGLGTVISSAIFRLFFLPARYIIIIF